MSANISRRNFLKLTGVGAAAVALTGCGPAARHVVRRPYYEAPEYSKLGESTYFATTCRECPAGCGIIMRTMEGRAIKAEGNPAHPVNRGKICSRGLTSVQGLYNPDRIKNPLRRTRGQEETTAITWDEAVSAAAGGMGAGTAFLLGLSPDHLFDLTTEISAAIGAQPPIRYSVSGFLEGRATLLAATLARFGQASLPFFDIANADLVFAFGGDFLGTWVSPVAYGRAYGAFRRFNAQKLRGYMVSFEPRMGVTSGAADEWVPVAPGSEGVVAQALAQIVAALRAGGDPAGVDLGPAAQASGVTAERLLELAERFAAAKAPLAIPGGSALAHANGMAAADAILSLNADRLDQPGGMTILPGPEAGAGAPPLAGVFNQVADLVARMNAGQVQALFIHGVNPLFDLPPALGFQAALAKVPLVISLSSFPDETALQADYVLPDHTGLESFGYQTFLPGVSVPVVSSIQPVVAPLYDTRAAADVLIAAAQQAGAGLAYNDEVAFIQTRLTPLLGQGGSVDAPTNEVFWAQFLQKGGWWALPAQSAAPAEGAAPADGQVQPPAQVPAQVPGPAVTAPDEDTFHLIPYATHFGDGSGANRPWLQETPDPMTTVTWNSWVEINPETAERLGIHHDDMVRVRSAAGEVEAAAYVYPAIRPDCIAIPFGQGHTALGRYAEGRGVNPLALVEVNVNDAGDLSLADTLVTIEKTGRRRPLARMESIRGVYGEH